MRSDFPVTEQLADEILSLPMYPELSDEAVAYVSETIAEFVGERNSLFAAVA